MPAAKPALIGEGDVAGGQVMAVVPADARFQGELDGEAPLQNLPALGQVAGDAPIDIVFDQTVKKERANLGRGAVRSEDWHQGGRLSQGGRDQRVPIGGSRILGKRGNACEGRVKPGQKGSRQAKGEITVSPGHWVRARASPLFPPGPAP